MMQMYEANFCETLICKMRHGDQSLPLERNAIRLGELSGGD